MFNSNNNQTPNQNEVKIGRSILNESDLKIQVQYKGEVFTLKYPTPNLKAVIENEIARRLGGYPRDSHRPDHVATIEAYVTVDLLTIPEESPRWFTGAWACYDEELIGTLFAGYLSFRDKFVTKLQSGGFERSDKG